MPSAIPPFLTRTTDPARYEQWVQEELSKIADASIAPSLLSDYMSNRDLRLVLAALAHPNFPKAFRRDLVRTALTDFTSNTPPSYPAYIGIRKWAGALQDYLFPSNTSIKHPSPWFELVGDALPPVMVLAGLTRSPTLSDSELKLLTNHALLNDSSGLQLVDLLDIQIEHSVRLDILQYMIHNQDIMPTTRARILTRLLSRPGQTDEFFTDTLCLLAESYGVVSQAIFLSSLSPHLARILALPKNCQGQLIASNSKDLRLFVIAALASRPKLAGLGPSVSLDIRQSFARHPPILSI